MEEIYNVSSHISAVVWMTVMFPFSHPLCLCCFLHFGCPGILLMIKCMSIYFKTSAPLLSVSLHRFEELDNIVLSSPSSR